MDKIVEFVRKYHGFINEDLQEEKRINETIKTQNKGKYHVFQ